MKLLNKPFQTAILVALILATGLLCFPEFLFAHSKKKYPLGFSARALEAIGTPTNQLARTGAVLPEDVSEDTKRRGYVYSLHVPREFLVLQFNYYQEVVDVRKVTPLALLFENPYR